MNTHIQRIICYSLLFFAGCNIRYAGSNPIPKTESAIKTYIAQEEDSSKRYQAELDQAEKDIKFAQEYLIKNPDTVWNQTGSHMLQRAQFKKDSALFFKEVADSRIKEAKELLEKINADKEGKKEMDEETQWIK